VSHRVADISIRISSFAAVVVYVEVGWCLQYGMVAPVALGSSNLLIFTDPTTNRLSVFENNSRLRLVGKSSSPSRKHGKVVLLFSLILYFGTMDKETIRTLHYRCWQSDLRLNRGVTEWV